jgi:2-amino-4-hydroxy-6-hydroxymethyldihydropteridine diphosphokinase
VTQGLYLIALGSNQRHPGHGAPRKVIRAALAALGHEGIAVERASPIIASRPLGPSRRTYANAAAVIRTRLDPPEVLAELQAIEKAFGRRRRGQPWSARVLDLDVVLWSGGAWESPGLVVPHVSFRERDFVLGPAARIAGDWRDPLSGLTVRQLRARLTRS